MKNKRGDSKYILILIVFIVLMAGIYYFNNKISNENFEEKDSKWREISNNETDGSFLDSMDSSGSNSNINGLEENNFEDNTGSGGGGGGSGSSTQITSEPTCEIRKISYSLKTINQSEDCLDFNGTECLEKEIICSTKITNEDAVPFEFEMELVFVPDGKSKELFSFGLLKQNYTIDSKNSEIMVGNAIITYNGSGENLANREINCFFNTINSFEQEICS